LKRESEIAVRIPAGIDDGEMIRLSGMGEATAHGAAGDLYVKVHVKPHRTLRREGMNLVMDLSVKLTSALLGDEYTIETLEGPMRLKIPESTSHGEILRVRGKGVPDSRGRRGDLLVKVQITFPTKLSREARKAVEDLRREGV
jgi:molecular chaperone DnaJ